MEQINVCIVVPSFYPAVVYGGPIFSTLYACNEIEKTGIKISVSSTNANGTSKLNLITNKWLFKTDNFRIKYYNETIVNRFSFQLFFNLWKDIKIADIIHIQAIFSTPTPIALFYSFVYGKPIILSPRGSLGEWCLKKKRSLFKSLWLKCLINPFKKKIIWHATSIQERSEILKIDDNARVVVIPNGFEPGLHYISEQNEKTDDEKIIISMGRIHEKKGYDILIKAFKKVLVCYPKAELFIAGKDDGAKEKLIELMENLQLENKVHFLDHLENQNKNKFLSDSDVFVLPSHNENFGNVYVEALAVGTPIVASTNTPWKEVEEAGCGRWVPNTIEDTASAILDILGRDREQLRQNAINYSQKFKWENIAFQFKDLYEKLLQSK